MTVNKEINAYISKPQKYMRQNKTLEKLHIIKLTLL